MPGETYSPSMGLVLPGVGVTPGPQYASDLNASLTILDSHNHSSGSGVQITPAGINVTSDLTMLSHNLTDIRSSRYSVQSSPLALSTDLAAVYVSGADLYYNDTSGNQVRLTQSGAVAGTPGSIANLVPPASASYVSLSSSFVFQSGATTPGNIDGASFILRNLLPGSPGLTLSAPVLSGNYTITLPTLPLATSFLTIDNSGNLTPGAVLSSAYVATANIANNAVTPAKIPDASIAPVKLTFSPLLNDVFTQCTVNQTIVVPAGVTCVEIEGWGGGGGGGASAVGAGGGGSSGLRGLVKFQVTPGESLNVTLGAGGTSGNGGGQSVVGATTTGWTVNFGGGAAGTSGSGSAGGGGGGQGTTYGAGLSATPGGNGGSSGTNGAGSIGSVYALGSSGGATATGNGGGGAGGPGRGNGGNGGSNTVGVSCANNSAAGGGGGSGGNIGGTGGSGIVNISYRTHA